MTTAISTSNIAKITIPYRHAFIISKQSPLQVSSVGLLTACEYKLQYAIYTTDKAHTSARAQMYKICGAE